MAAHGFADPVFEAQETFRAAMQALSRPGELFQLQPELMPPGPLTPELAALALTLVDHETTVWLDPALAADAAAVDFLRFHTGASVVEAPARAAFALVSDPSDLPPLGEFAQGKPDYPDRSTTVLMAVSGLHAGGALVLSGPGIAGENRLAVDTLPPDFLADWHDNHAAFPIGVDVLLVAPGAVVGLPRTTLIREA